MDKIGGTSVKRAVGWTAWSGVYHYTTAQVQDGSRILTTSGRKWGLSRTEATSPWWYFDGYIFGSARTYYGN